MTVGQFIATHDHIQIVVRQIVAHCHPQKVILFGSYARGAASEDSDVDLLVIMDTNATPLHAAADIAAAVDHPFPLDIIVVRPSDWEASLRRRSAFAVEAASEGAVLYEA